MLTLRRALLGAVLCAILGGALPAAANAQATRTWVSGTGDDVNPCSRTAPCKTWAGAISKTADGGVMDALDPGGYGTVTITKGMTIDGGGFVASALATGTFGININAPGKDVVLRDIDIAGACTPTGTNGIQILEARTVRIDGVHISGFSTNNVSVTPSNQSTNVYVTDSDMKGSCGAAPNGIRVAPGVPLRANVFVDGSSFTNLATALLVDANGHAFVTGSTFFNNSEGLSTMNGGVIDGLGGNHFGGNAYNGAFNTGSRSASRSAAARIGRRTGNRSTRWLTRAVRRV